MKITCVCNQQAYATSFVCETPVGTGRAEDYRLKLSLGKRAITKQQDPPKIKPNSCVDLCMLTTLTLLE